MVFLRTQREMVTETERRVVEFNERCRRLKEQNAKED